MTASATPVSLLEAFREIAFLEMMPLAPANDDASRAERRRIDALNAPREAAARLLHAELARIAARVAPAMSATRQDAGDAAHVVLWRLLKHGPRGERAKDPDTDGRVSAYLTTCVKNALLDMQVGTGTTSPPPEDTSSPPEETAPDVSPLLDEARVVVRNSILPRVLGTLAPTVAKRRERLFDQLCAIRDGTMTRDEMRGKASLDALYKRCSRFLGELRDELDRYAKELALEEDERAVLRAVIDELGLRHNRTPARMSDDPPPAVE